MTERVQHGWDSGASMSGRGVCTCGWGTNHYALASDPDLDREFDQHLEEAR